MELDAFDFDLPDELIALRPVRPRSAARLLVARGAETHDSRVADLPDWLRPGDMLVFNDTLVIPARLTGERRRPTADGSGVAHIEATLIRREGPATWTALARPGRRLIPGDRIAFGALTAEVLGRAGTEVRLRFDRAGAELDAAVAETGVMPLPHYIAGRRPADAQDLADYQTVFAEKPGAVAAPTASLHFDTGLLARLAGRGILSARITLHVGAGTFLPVTAVRVEDHRMHAERGEIGADAARAMNAARAAGGRLIPVGTTALRLLEISRRHDGPHSAIQRRDRHLHPAGPPLPRGGRADDELPSAALDALHAGLGADGPRSNAGALRPRDRAALPLLLLRRRLALAAGELGQRRRWRDSWCRC